MNSQVSCSPPCGFNGGTAVWTAPPTTTTTTAAPTTTTAAPTTTTAAPTTTTAAPTTTTAAPTTTTAAPTTTTAAPTTTTAAPTTTTAAPTTTTAAPTGYYYNVDTFDCPSCNATPFTNLVAYSPVSHPNNLYLNNGDGNVYYINYTYASAQPSYDIDLTGAAGDNDCTYACML